MYRKIALSIALFLSQLWQYATAHEMTPTYPQFRMSYIPDIAVTEMRLFNKRKDVEWYEIEVFDGEWNRIPFVSSHKVMQLNYLEQVDIEIYMRNKDLDRVLYICSTSKLRRDNTSNKISTKICSKVK